MIAVKKNSFPLSLLIRLRENYSGKITLKLRVYRLISSTIAQRFQLLWFW